MLPQTTKWDLVEERLEEMKRDQKKWNTLLEFTKKRYVGESISFLLAVNNYEKQVKLSALKVWDLYRHIAETEINLPPEIRAEIVLHLASPSVNMFKKVKEALQSYLIDNIIPKYEKQHELTTDGKTFLAQLSKTPKAFKKFKQLAKKYDAEEHLKLMIQIDNFEEVFKNEAEMVFSEYIGLKAPNPINITGKVIAEIEEKMAQPDVDLFINIKRELGTMLIGIMADFDEFQSGCKYDDSQSMSMNEKSQRKSARDLATSGSESEKEVSSRKRKGRSSDIVRIPAVILPKREASVPALPVVSHIQPYQKSVVISDTINLHSSNKLSSSSQPSMRSHNVNLNLSGKSKSTPPSPIRGLSLDRMDRDRDRMESPSSSSTKSSRERIGTTNNKAIEEMFDAHIHYINHSFDSMLSLFTAELERQRMLCINQAQDLKASILYGRSDDQVFTVSVTDTTDRNERSSKSLSSSSFGGRSLPNNTSSSINDQKLLSSSSEFAHSLVESSEE
eukprot:TRINITY_DN6206_c0_g1_i2.p1 TRINITY_DN6206_c0_g1~~TRINITY_DN6206_c0_g1_i2.p1  ORF type:complete len:504 (+),score=126.77 TRINITY_DN6206_c0_g1_i2:64-1575(+)